PPAFGLKVKSVDDVEARSMPGIRDVFVVKSLEDDYEWNAFDTASFTDHVVVVGNTTWEVMNARKALKIEWENVADRQIVVDGWGGKQTMRIPGALESTNRHRAVMEEMSKKPAQVLRKDGDPETAFKKAARVIERTYTAPYLAHNCM